MKNLKFLTIVLITFFCFSFNPLSVQALDSNSTENISFSISGQNFTYENAPIEIKEMYLENCISLGVLPSFQDEIFVPSSLLETLGINKLRSSSETYNVDYDGTYIYVTGYRNYTIYVNTTFVGYNFLTSGNSVHCLQLLLSKINSHYNLFSPIAIDSLFGSNTHNALIQFQSFSNLSVDGICGPNTWRKFFTYF